MGERLHATGAGALRLGAQTKRKASRGQVLVPREGPQER